VTVFVIWARPAAGWRGEHSWNALNLAVLSRSVLVPERLAEPLGMA
jgi:hypothetical protein